MKKRFGLAIAAMLAAATGLFSVACSAEPKNDHLFDFEITRPDHNAEFTLDEGAEVDGKRDEDFWGGPISFNQTGTDVTVCNYAYLGQNGLYLFAEVNDTDVYWSVEKNFFENDSVEFYIDPRPDYTMTLNALNSSERVRSDCLQIRVDVAGRVQTWFGRKTSETAYPWVAGHVSCLAVASVHGELNVAGGASGYGVELFVPWDQFGLEQKPEAVGVMPAFNNVQNREDTSRIWFSFKGMSHSEPTGYARVDDNGYTVPTAPDPVKALTASWDDPAYVGGAVDMFEVNADNSSPEVRASVKGFLGEDGAYFAIRAFDKVKSQGSDNIWANDGVELVIDTTGTGGDYVHKSGVTRIGADIDGGLETDICLGGYGNYLPQRLKVFLKTSASAYTEENSYGYKYCYVYELMVPYSTLGLDRKPEKLTFGWAVKTPNETAYILDRRDGGSGRMEGQDWLWINRHYPKNPGEYYTVTAAGVSEFAFPDWSEHELSGDETGRYGFRAFVAEEGLYINAVQRVNSYTSGASSGNWTKITHVEAEIWTHSFGSGDTYFAFFPDGSYYCNSEKNITGIKTAVTVGDDPSSTYRYELSYEVFIAYKNTALDGCNIQFMSFTADELGGYDHSVSIIKDSGMASERLVHTDKCRYYPVTAEGVGEPVRYSFGEWTDWESLETHSDAPGRYDVRGKAAAEGVYFNVVQYVDSYISSAFWENSTHVELFIFNDNFGFGAGGTYLGLFMNGVGQPNNMTKIKSYEFLASVCDRGAGMIGQENGYRYAVSYEVFIGFDNSALSKTTFRLMTMAPGESGGFGDSVNIVRDNRILTTDTCKEYVLTDKLTRVEYAFTGKWDEWGKAGTVRSQHQSRYDFRGKAADEGLYINVVQYVDTLKYTGNGFTQKDHIEMIIWNGDYGAGWNGTWVSFFADNTEYHADKKNETAYEFRVSIVDRGEGYTDGYRYMINYEIFIGFPNNTASADDPYAFIKFMFITPGETEGYEGCATTDMDATTDPNHRTMLHDACASYRFAPAGIVERCMS